jgi:hypothetical protein
MNPTLRSLCVAMFAAALPAQKLLLPDDSGRIVQLFDLDFRTGGKDPHFGIERTVALLTRLITPELNDGDDLRLIGKRWLTLLGTPQQAASIESLLRTAKTRHQEPIEVTTHMFTMSAEKFAAHWKPLLIARERNARTTFEAVVDSKEGTRLHALATLHADQTLASPRLSVLPLQSGTMAVKTEIPYVQDFEVKQTKDSVIADPIVGTVWEGTETIVCATYLADGTLALSCEAMVQEVLRPIPTFKTQIGVAKAEVTIQLPRVVGVGVQQTAIVANEGMVLLAAQKVDGSYLLTTITARTQPK